MPNVAGLPRRQHKKGPLARLRSKRRPPTMGERIKSALRGERMMAMRASLREKGRRVHRRLRPPARED